MGNNLPLLGPCVPISIVSCPFLLPLHALHACIRAAKAPSLTAHPPRPPRLAGQHSAGQAGAGQAESDRDAMCYPRIIAPRPASVVVQSIWAEEDSLGGPPARRITDSGRRPPPCHLVLSAEVSPCGCAMMSLRVRQKKNIPLLISASAMHYVVASHFRCAVTKVDVAWLHRLSHSMYQTFDALLTIASFVGDGMDPWGKRADGVPCGCASLIFLLFLPCQDCLAM